MAHNVLVKLINIGTDTWASICPNEAGATSTSTKGGRISDVVLQRVVKSLIHRAQNEQIYIETNEHEANQCC